MDAKKRQKIVYIFFGLAIIYGLYNYMNDFGKKKSEPVPSVADQVQAQVIPPAQSIDIDKYAALEWGRDPFYLPKANGQIVVHNDPVNWVLNGILYDSKAPSAVINNKIVKIGDDIGEAKVIKITKSNVTIKINDSEYRTLEVTKGNT